VLAVKVALVALAATLTEVATLSTDGRLLESVTVVLVAEDFDRVTVQVVLELGARLVAVHCRDETVGRVARARLAVADEEPSVPVIVTF
jgi:hypothetical protein